jgi:hypothetical protein
MSTSRHGDDTQSFCQRRDRTHDRTACRALSRERMSWRRQSGSSLRRSQERIVDVDPNRAQQPFSWNRSVKRRHAHQDLICTRLHLHLDNHACLPQDEARRGQCRCRWPRPSRWVCWAMGLMSRWAEEWGELSRYKAARAQLGRCRV